MTRFSGPRGRLLSEKMDEVLAVVHSNNGDRVHVFGSVARNEDTSTSDIDLVVTFRQGASLFDQLRIQRRLEGLLGCGVEVLSMGGLLRNLDGRCQSRRDRILNEAVPLS